MSLELTRIVVNSTLEWIINFVYKYFRYEREDGRIQYPLCFIFSSPAGTSGKQMMAYASSRNQSKHLFLYTLIFKIHSVRDMAGVTKVFELRSTEDLTQEWLSEKLKFFS